MSWKCRPCERRPSLLSPVDSLFKRIFLAGWKTAEMLSQKRGREKLFPRIRIHKCTEEVRGEHIAEPQAVQRYGQNADQYHGRKEQREGMRGGRGEYTGGREMLHKEEQQK